MNLQSVEPKGLYKKQYIKHGNSIYDVEYLKKLEAYEKVDFEALKKSKAKVLFSKCFVYPSNKKMEEKLAQKRKQIYDALKLNEITGKDADVTKAFVLFKYLSSQVEYNMMALEKRPKPTSLYKKLQTVINEKNSQARYIGYKLFEVPKFTNIAYKLFEKETDILNRIRLTKMYNALIYNTGVCADFTHAYNYLLSGLNIENYTCMMSGDTKGYKHIISVVKKQNKNSYYFVDVTAGLAKQDKNETYGFGFIHNFHTGLNYKDENNEVIIKELCAVYIKGKPKLKEVILSQKEMVEKFKKLETVETLNNAIKNATSFMQNGYTINKEYEL